MANSNAGTIAQYILNILRTNGASTDLPSLQDAPNSFLYTMISNANSKYLRSFRKTGGSEPLVQSSDTGFTLVSDTDLNGAITAASTSIVVDGALNDAKNGALVAWDNNMPDVIFYTTYDGVHTATGVTKIGFNHADETPVQSLYKLPSDFRTFRPSDTYGDGVRISGLPMRYMEGFPLLGYFSLVDNGTNKYLWVPRGYNGPVSIQYEKNPTTITQSSDIIDVPPEFEFFVVWEAITTLVIPKGDTAELYAIAKKEAAEELRDALRDKNISKYARVRPLPRLRRRPFDFSNYISQPR